MCGICGVAGGDAVESRELVGRMCAAMVHRGPDDEGSVQLDGVTLECRRLSIIDVEGGHQPIHNEDSTVWVVQNGEIYNHLELRDVLIRTGHSFATQSDTEVLVHGYEEWGEAMVERLNGMFAFALYDSRRRRVLWRAIAWASNSALRRRRPPACVCIRVEGAALRPCLTQGDRSRRPGRVPRARVRAIAPQHGARHQQAARRAYPRVVSGQRDAPASPLLGAHAWRGRG